VTGSTGCQDDEEVTDALTVADVTAVTTPNCEMKYRDRPEGAKCHPNQSGALFFYQLARF
jgi:hypothetical protein